jgi:hypothetical protein
MKKRKKTLGKSLHEKMAPKGRYLTWQIHDEIGTLLLRIVRYGAASAENEDFQAYLGTKMHPTESERPREVDSWNKGFKGGLGSEKETVDLWMGTYAAKLRRSKQTFTRLAACTRRCLTLNF